MVSERNEANKRWNLRVPKAQGAGIASEAPRPLPGRGSLQQGLALATLGHAIDYLVDSRIFLAKGTDPRDHRDALHILMRSSRDVFSEYPKAVPLWRRLDRFCRRSLERIGG